MPTSSLPIVDLSSPTAPATLYAACKTQGFFYLTNHGVPASLVQEMLAQSKAFFALPLGTWMAG